MTSNNDLNDSIFLQRSETDDLKKNNECDSAILSRKEVANMIPHDCLREPDTELLKSKTEWRWRIFKFPDNVREIVEISFKPPDQGRVYIDKKGEWVNSEVSKEFDIYVTSEYYHYTSNAKA